MKQSYIKFMLHKLNVMCVFAADEFSYAAKSNVFHAVRLKKKYK